MALRLRVKEVARQKGFSMGKLQRDADVAYNTVKRMYKNPYHVITTGNWIDGTRRMLSPDQ
jgi:lambda repressor-like predicted transcriptional regulator